MSKYSKNFILCGAAESHCLVCNETFLSDGIDKHLRWEQHRKTVKVQVVMHKYRKDSIYKLSTYYYCEHCNFIIQNANEIKTHIDSEYHINCKNNPENIPKRIEAKYECGNIVINKKVINKNQWHGILNNMCVFCDQYVGNIGNHITDQDHMIKMIQSEVKCTDDNHLYRKINKENFQCFTCNKTYPLSCLDDHWATHSDKKITISINQNNNIEVINEKIRVPMKETSDKKEIYGKVYSIDMLNVTDDPYFDIDLNNNQVTCKKCNKNLETSYEQLKDHLFEAHEILSRKPESTIITAIWDKIEEKYVFVNPDSGKERSEAAAYGKQNYIKMKAGGGQGYCTLCDRMLSGHIKIFKSHVEGSIHQGHLELKGFIKQKKHAKRSCRVEKFDITEFPYSSTLEGFWIDRDLVLEPYNYVFFKRIEHGPHFKKTKCFACDELLSWGREKDHIATEKHKTNFLNAKIVCVDTEKNIAEFVREVQPQLYHCGCCNVSLPFFESVGKHLNSHNHKMKRMECSQLETIKQMVATGWDTWISKSNKSGPMYSRIVVSIT